MKGTRVLVWMLALVLAVFTSHCDEGNGVVEDADAREGDVPSEAEVDVHVDDVPGEDIRPEEVIEDPVAEDITEVDGPETVTITGQVWSYTLMMDTEYYVQPERNIVVTVEGEGITTGDLTATTSTVDCETWWSMGEPFECGKFTISDVPAGVEIMLRASGLVAPDAGPESISKIFTAQEGDFVLLVVVSQELIDAMLDAWTITQDADNGMVVGLLASNLNPDSFYDPDPTDTTACPHNPASCVVSGFIGAATVAITPDPTCTDCNRVIYYDSVDYTNTDRTDTDPEQSLFFVTNSPARERTDPYTIAVEPATINIEDTTFAVEAGKVTYLLLMP